MAVPPNFEQLILKQVTKMEINVQTGLCVVGSCIISSQN